MAKEESIDIGAGNIGGNGNGNGIIGSTGSDGDESSRDPDRQPTATHVYSESDEKKGIHNVHPGTADDDMVNGHLVELEVDLSRVIGEDDVEGDWDADTSPFPAVRAVVPETDDTEMPVNTFRAWFLGIVSIFKYVYSAPTH